MDTRTKRQKLQAMANQTESPNEAEVAKRLLVEMGPEPPKIINAVNVIYINGRAYVFGGAYTSSGVHISFTMNSPKKY